VPGSQLVILGAGGHGVSAYSVALSAGFDVAKFVDPQRRGGKLLGTEIVGELSEISAEDGIQVFLAIGDNNSRFRVHEELLTRYPTLSFPKLIHASAVVSPFASIGDGTIVMPGSIVGPNTTIGRFCILNTRSAIDHDGAMADCSSLAPGVTTGGRVRIGLRSAISIGAIIKHDIVIGDDCVVGAGSYVNANLPGNCVAYGTPAKIVRSRSRVDRYL
jgi:sugar O-acyltransferase (sialic acid O-acetyltransferase NeuD family)